MAALPHILDAPAQDGVLRAVIRRPDHGQREMVETVSVSAEFGVDGDHWSKGCWRTTEDGAPHPDVQICMMNARCIEAIAGDVPNWAPAGDNLFIDMDLSPANMPPGTRFTLGSAEMVVTPEPHNGCQSFIDRYGREACVFVNTGLGREYRLRGIYARVLRDGVVRVGDRLHKLD